MHGGDKVKKIVFSLVVVALLVAVAVPVLAAPKLYWNADTIDDWEFYHADMPLPTSDNRGCSAGWYGIDAKKFELEYLTAYANYDKFTDDLVPGDESTPFSIEGVKDAYDAAGKDGKQYVEYLKLWNKGYLAQDEDGNYYVVKTCEIKE
jgi:hypothetical protein